MSSCSSRLKGLGCSLSADHAHDVHVSIDAEGRVVARWRMVAQELPVNPE